MRPEKEYLVEETEKYLRDSNYVLLADFERVTVAEVADLRSNLAKEGAQYHVVKNRIFRVAAKKQGLPELGNVLKGHTAIITGGSNPSGVAKVIKTFQKSFKVEKATFKGGILEKEVLSAANVMALADLPSKEALRAQLLALFNAPAQQCVRVLNAVPQGLLNVLQAKADKAA